MDYSKHFNNKNTDVNEPLIGKNQVKNNSGGFVFEISSLERLKRFLILGSDKNTYYQHSKELTIENAKSIVSLITSNGVEAVKTIVEISASGRAPKNDAAIFALALATTFGDVDTKKLAYSAIKEVCRTGTHLFSFCEAIQKLRGWSAGLRNGVSGFYALEENKLAYQLLKYRQRNGWTHRDVLRLAHTKPKSKVVEKLFKMAVSNYAIEDAEAKDLPEIVQGFLLAQSETDEKKLAKIVSSYGLTWEMIPTQFLNSKLVWGALLPNLPMNALLRNLNKMTAIGLLDNNLSDTVRLVNSKLTDPKYVFKSKIHPITILTALSTYRKGHGVKGSLTWSPVNSITDSLDLAFYLAFGNVEATGKNIMLALDISASMTWAETGAGISPREASAALAMITNTVEKNVEIVGFSNSLINLNLSKKTRLDAVIDYISSLPCGSTDCSLPIIHAMKKKLPIDTFIVFTDNEVNTGTHPSEALKLYRKTTGRDAKLIVVAMTSSGFTIADPNDRGMLDVVGFDTNVPNLISNFIKE